MLRRAREEGQPVIRAAAAFGFSRPTFYAARARFEAGGLPGLVPERPGPRRAHKLSAPVVEALAAARTADPSLGSADLARIAGERFGIRVHRRSVERALARRKRGLRESP
jgi:transposase